MIHSEKIIPMLITHVEYTQCIDNHLLGTEDLEGKYPVRAVIPKTDEIEIEVDSLSRRRTRVKSTVRFDPNDVELEGSGLIFHLQDGSVIQR